MNYSIEKRASRKLWAFLTPTLSNAQEKKPKARGGRNDNKKMKKKWRTSLK